MCILATVATMAIACSRELPPISPRPLPEPDGREPLLGERPLSERLASYRLEVVVDVGAHRLTGRETLRWKHAGTAPVKEIPLHLYMNAFKNEDTTFMRERGGHGRAGRGKPEAWGWIEVTSIRDGERELRATARYGDGDGDDETVLWVPLGRDVSPGEEVVLDLDFTTQLPTVLARTGFKGDFMMVGQWFPKAGVLIGADWHADVFHANSEFFADFGAYDVVLDVPDTHVVAATGVLVASAAGAPGRRTLTYRAEDVHDFAFMLDPHMKVARGTARTANGEVEIRVYHRPGYEKFASRHIAAARRTLELLSENLVPYPWPIMSIIEPPWNAVFGAGGMEYPTLVTTAGAIDLDGLPFAEETTVHEVTHNWFQGILASNEVDEAFLDEGLTEFVTGVVMDDLLGEDRSAFDSRVLRLGYFDRIRLDVDTAELAGTTATPSYRMLSGEYGDLTYRKTAQALRTLEGMVGRPRLLAALGGYAKRHAFRHPTRADLFAALNEGLGEDFGWFLEPAFLDTGSVDYRVGAIKVHRRTEPRGVFGEGAARRVVTEGKELDGWRSEVTVTRHGRVPARVEIGLVFADGTQRTETWDGRAPFRRFEFDHPTPLDTVIVDPRGLLNLEHSALDNGVAPADHGPSFRAGARAGFWLQTAAQMVGL